MTYTHIGKIISGGQTGVDRGGLEAGLRLGLPIGGWCPLDRRAEDGRIPDRYPLREHSSRAYPPRTEANVIEADATAILYTGELERGSKLTRDLALRYAKPHKLIPIDLLDDAEAALTALRPWLFGLHELRGRPLVLNVAGPRESQSPGIQLRAERILVAAILGVLL